MTPPFSYLFLTNSAVVEGIRMWGEESRTGTACVQSRKKRKSAGEWKNPQRLVVRNVMKALFSFFYRTTPRNHNTQKTELLWLPHGTSVRLPFNTSARLICALKHIKTNIPSTLLDLLCWQMIDVIPEARLELNKLVRKTQGHKHRMHLNEKMAISSFALCYHTSFIHTHICRGPCTVPPVCVFKKGGSFCADRYPEQERSTRAERKTVFLPVSTFLFLPSSILSSGCCCSFSSFLFSITHLLSFSPLFHSFCPASSLSPLSLASSAFSLITL